MYIHIHILIHTYVCKKNHLFFIFLMFNLLQIVTLFENEKNKSVNINNIIIIEKYK